MKIIITESQYNILLKEMSKYIKEKQSNVSKDSYNIFIPNKDGEHMAYLHYKVNPYGIVYIEDIYSKKKGYGTKLMKYLVDKYGYSNIGRKVLTSKGRKFINKMDIIFDRDSSVLEEILFSDEDISKIKNDDIKLVLNSLIVNGDKIDLKNFEDFNLNIHPFTFEDLYEFSKWILGSITVEKLYQEIPNNINVMYKEML